MRKESADSTSDSESTVCTPQFKNYVATLFFTFLAEKAKFGRVYKPEQEFRGILRCTGSQIFYFFPLNLSKIFNMEHGQSHQEGTVPPASQLSTERRERAREKERERERKERERAIERERERGREKERDLQ